MLSISRPQILNNIQNWIPQFEFKLNKKIRPDHNGYDFQVAKITPADILDVIWAVSLY